MQFARRRHAAVVGAVGVMVKVAGTGGRRAGPRPPLRVVVRGVTSVVVVGCRRLGLVRSREARHRKTGPARGYHRGRRR